MKFAVLNGNIVSNVIIADSLEIAEEVTGSKCVEYSDNDLVDIGNVYDEINKIFVKNIDL